MISLPGYHILETVASARRSRPGDSASPPTSRTTVYRAYRHSDRRAAIVKTSGNRVPSLMEIARLRHEYNIVTTLSSPYIIRAYEFIERDESTPVAAVYEDIGGQSLDRLVPQLRDNLPAQLDIAIQLAKALNDLHQARIVHKDIKPQNIVYNPDSGQLKLIDFGIASRLSQELPAAVGATGAGDSAPFGLNRLEGTLAYISPEQTGRMNRPLDYRTDFYSLGVTLYELLTGQLPFRTDDALELVHAHIAKVPTPPAVDCPEVPNLLSDLVMKLLAKNAEDRYQSAFGLLRDLETCRQRLRGDRTIPPFPLGQFDVSAQLQIPAKLYGREAEVERLMAACDRVCDRGFTPNRSELLLVAGYSGVGKSVLVREIQRPLARRRGNFVSGKFERLKRNLPYFAVRQALSERTTQLLAESRPRLDAVRSQLQRRLGGDREGVSLAAVAVELVPELAPLLPPVRVPTDASTALRNEVFCQLVEAFAQPEHPLVLFLDDLQWADSASLKLLVELLSRTRSRPLLVVGAYRDNEVTPAHPLMLALDDLRRQDIVPEQLALQNLDRDCVSELVADTLHLSTEAVEPLADLVYRKTNGNPFFLTQLLVSLARDELLWFDGDSGRWTWDMARLDAVEICENVIDLTVRKLQTLSLDTQNLLMLAACIGNRFDLNVLSVVNERSPRRTAADLWDAIRQGTIVPLNEAYKVPLALSAEGDNAADDAAIAQLPIAYKFLHDRVQQAAYALIDPEIRQDVRVQIGRLLLDSTPPEQLEERIFEIVNQFDAGASLMVRAEERRQLAQLNLMAARKAKAAAAYETASEYLDVGRTALGDEGWTAEYELTLALHLEAVEVETAIAQFERAEVLARALLEHTRSPEDRARTLALQVRGYSAQQRGDRAWNAAMAALEQLKLTLVEETLPEEVPPLGKQPLADPRLTLAMGLLEALVGTMVLGDAERLRRVVLTQLRLSQRAGYDDRTAIAYVWYGALALERGATAAAQTAIGRSRAVLDRLNADSVRRERVVGLTAAAIDPYLHAPLSQTLPVLRRVLSISDPTLQPSGLGLMARAYGVQAFWGGVPTLIAASEALDTAIARLRDLHQAPLQETVAVWRQLVANLRGDLSNPLELVGSYASAEAQVRQMRERDASALERSVWVARLVLAVVMADATGAKTARRALLQPGHAPATLEDRYALGYGILAQLMAAGDRPENSSEDSSEVRGDGKAEPGDRTTPELQPERDALAKLAQQVPANFQALLNLVDAERSRVAGDFLAAMDGYDRAIATAKQHGRWGEAGLASERAAAFYVTLGREPIAHLYGQEAQQHYQTWGATAKVRHLSRQQRSSPPKLTTMEPEVPAPPSTTAGLSETVLETAIARPADMLDRVTAVKATHALSSEIVLESLLAKLIEIVLENAGAQTGYLILAAGAGGHNGSGDRLVVEAMGTVTTERVSVRQGVPVELCESLPHSVVYYVARCRESVALDNAAALGSAFANDPYIQRYRPRSLLCAPIERQGKLVGVLYLENNLTVGAFTRDRLDLLGLLCSQAAISIENATLYETLQASERRERDRAEQLERSLAELEQAQVQLVQSEKMSALGQLMAGIAHEINNPIGFIVGNLTLADNYIEDLIEHLELYRDRLPEPDAEILQHAEDVDLDYLLEDAPKLMASMQVGVDRIRDISKALRTFARSDTDNAVRTDLHDALESTLLILKHRLKGNETRPAIEIVRQYGDLPPVECFAGQLNQVFTNTLANAIDALEESSQDRSFQELREQPNRITLTTELSADGERAIVRVADNGVGMPESVRSQIFERNFTTKGVGKGTGLGLAICQQIVEEKHGGTLTCRSAFGKGTEFAIEIPVRRPA